MRNNNITSHNSNWMPKTIRLHIQILPAQFNGVFRFFSILEKMYVKNITVKITMVELRVRFAHIDPFSSFMLTLIKDDC